MRKLCETAEFQFFTLFSDSESTPISIFNTLVPAGFPSPAEDYQEEKIDLNQYLIANPLSTFMIRVKGNSMEGARIYDGSLLVVDRSVKPKSTSSCLCILNGEFTVKKIRKFSDKLFLIPENPAFKEIEITAEMDFEVWGVVIHIITKPS